MPENYLTNGINFLYFGDFHYQEKAPSRRIDNFEETEFRKAKLIQELAKKHNVRAYLQSGDFLDKPRISDSFMQKIFENWNFKQSVKNREDYENGLISKEEYADRQLEQIPIIGIVGNHEVFGGALKNFNRTSLKTLSDAGFMNLVGRRKPYIFTLSNGKTIAISGQPYDLRLLKSPENFKLHKKFADVDIFMVHEALYNTELEEGMQWMPINKVSKDTKADLTIAGHIHNGFGWIEENGRLFGNPGVPAQQTASQRELDRDIVVTLIHVSDDCEIFLQDIILDTPRSRELFDLTITESEKEQEAQMKKVREIIDSVEKIGDKTALEIIEKVAKTENVDKRVLELATSTTENVMSSFGDINSLDDNVDYHISQIILEDFESHQYSVIDLPDDNLPTVLIGESSHGKSSILRAIYWVLENEGNALDFIRRSKNVATTSVTLVRSDGLKVKRFATKRKKRDGSWTLKENAYKIIKPNGESFETNTQGLEIVQQLFGLSKLSLDQKDSIGINFQKQEDPWFFLGLNSLQRAKVIGSIYGTQHILGGIKQLESNRRKLQQEANVLKRDSEDLTSSLKELVTTEEKLKIISKTNSSLEKLEYISNLERKLSSEVIDYQNLYQKQNILETFLNTAKTAPTLNKDILCLQEQMNSYKLLTEYIDANNHLKNEEQLLRNQILIKNDAVKIGEKIKLLNKYTDVELILSKNVKVYKHGLELISSYEGLVSEKENLGLLKEQLNSAKSLSEQLDELKAYIKLNADLKNQETQLSEIIEFDLAKIGMLVEKINNFRNLYDKLSILKSEHDKNEADIQLATSFIQEKHDEATILSKEIKTRMSELKFKRFLKIGDKTLFGVGTVLVEGDSMEDSKLEELKERYSKVTQIIIKAETRLEEVNKRQLESKQKISELGIEPDDAENKLQELQTEMKNLESSIESGLSKIEELTKKMEE